MITREFKTDGTEFKTGGAEVKTVRLRDTRPAKVRDTKCEIKVSKTEKPKDIKTARSTDSKCAQLGDLEGQAALLPDFTPFEHPEDNAFFDFSTLLTEKELLAKQNFIWTDDPTIEDIL